MYGGYWSPGMYGYGVSPPLSSHLGFDVRAGEGWLTERQMNPYSYYAGGLGIPYMMGMGGYGASPPPPPPPSLLTVLSFQMSADDQDTVSVCPCTGWAWAWDIRTA